MAKILIVEDNAMIREILRIVLESATHTVEEADDGDVALDRGLARFDLVITDLFMPRIHGFDVIKAAVAAGIPTVAVSGGDRCSGEDPLVTALDLGACLAFRKPFAAAQLMQGVRDCLGGTVAQARVIEYARG